MRGIIGIVMFLVGITFTCYFYFEWSYAKESAEKLTDVEIKEYETKLNNTTPIIATNVNQKTSTTIQDMETKESEEDIKQSFHPGEKMAKLIIPDLGLQYSVYWGTDNNTLKKGVGMFVSDLTTTPSEMGHTVLSGHRDTVFTRLGELKDGDKIIVEYENELYEYQIKKTWITNSEDRTVIVPKDIPTLTLTTCYPFNMIGNAPDRYIIQADLVVKA